MSARRIVQGLKDALGIARGDISKMARASLHDPRTGARLVTITPYFYLAVQDGRWDDREFSTEKEAKAALRAISKTWRSGICVMSAVRYS